jgi:nitrogen-specific signal transduction histidine kinase/ActR/RegA family two-component response regulator
VTVSAVPFERDGAPGALVFFNDVSEQTRSEAERRLLEDQFRQSQKLESVGRLAGGVAHDFNNLLMIIAGYSQMLQDDTELHDHLRDPLEQISRAAARAADLTRQLLAFSRRQISAPQKLAVNELLGGIEKMLRRLIGEDIRLSLSLSPDAGAIAVDPGQFEQVIMNLAVNARDAMPQGGKLAIETARMVAGDSSALSRLAIPPGVYAAVTVSDTVTGMSAEAKAHVFEPFFTTKEAGKGTGLGLSTVYGIVKQSGGFIWVYSELGKGTSFKIYIPRVDQAEEHPGAPKPTAEVPTGTETVLLTEDEQDVREIAREFLESGGYKVVEAKDASEAVQLARQHNGAIDLLVTDMVMPGMTGQELAVQLQREYPGLCIVFMSGYSEHAATEMANADPTVRLLSKPFSRGALLRTVREILHSRKHN